jgi:drug/metabolite transporter (DMT)-like permease
MWILFALTAGALFAATTLQNKSIAAKGVDPWILSSIFSGVGAIVTMPFLFIQAEYVAIVDAWVVIVATACVVVLHNFLNFTALKYLSASAHGTFYKLRLVFAFLLGVIAGYEVASLHIFFGVVLVIAAGALLLWKRGSTLPTYGVACVLGAALLNACAFVGYKHLLTILSVETLTFLMFCIPAIINSFLVPHFAHKMRAALSRSGYLTVLCACVSGVAANIAMNYAIQLGTVSGTLVVVETGILLVLAGEYVILRDRKDLLSKCIAVLVALCGSLLIVWR